jgi:small subunit ribosomal protein S20
MAIKKSAKKAAKRALKNREVNLQFKIAMKKAIKNFLKAIEEKKTQDELLQMLPGVYKAIDKAAKRGVIKKQNAARRKSRLTKKIAALV